MSQNCVSSNWPPGALKQHVSATAEVLWQLRGVEGAQDADVPSRGGGDGGDRGVCCKPVKKEEVDGEADDNSSKSGSH